MTSTAASMATALVGTMYGAIAANVFFGPMAVAIMGGLTVATVLTLFFLPALYAAWFKVKPEPDTGARG